MDQIRLMLKFSLNLFERIETNQIIIDTNDSNEYDAKETFSLYPLFLSPIIASLRLPVVLVAVTLFKSPATGTNPLTNCACLSVTSRLLDRLLDTVGLSVGLVEGCVLKSDGRIDGNKLGLVIDGKS
mmetsp:Transcript_20391/g.42454  ORF Transcript_20391/g.42454 Transcript_20391/m.42454 type:complete len:127 (+) Transcript_20391:77-457(+)